MTPEEHRERHIKLHHYLDELIADWSASTSSLPSENTVEDLMHWSHQQTQEPDHSVLRGATAMTPEQMVINETLARELKEWRVPQNSYFVWDVIDTRTCLFRRQDVPWSDRGRTAAAFTIGELFHLLESMHANFLSIWNVGNGQYESFGHYAPTPQDVVAQYVISWWKTRPEAMR